MMVFNSLNILIAFWIILLDGRGRLWDIFSFIAFHINQMIKAPMLKGCESEYKRHQSPIQSLKDPLFSWVLNPKEKLNQIDCEKSQLKKR